VLLTIGMLALMAVAIVVLGRGWPRSSRGGGYRAGRGLGAGETGPGAGAATRLPPVPEDDDARWRWSGEPEPRDGEAPDRPDGPELAP
jgi:hypothetical protein